MVLTVERILILGMTPLAEQLLREIAARPACRRIVVGVLDDAAPTEQCATGLFAGELSRLRPIVEELQPDRIVVALPDRKSVV